IGQRKWSRIIGRTQIRRGAIQSIEDEAVGETACYRDGRESGGDGGKRADCDLAIDANAGRAVWQNLQGGSDTRDSAEGIRNDYIIMTGVVCTDRGQAKY